MSEGKSHLRFRLLCNQGIGQRIRPAFSTEVNNVSIFRLIDKQFQHHYVSAGQLWKANQWTLTEGLFFFNLSSDIELDFGDDHFPYPDVWVSVAKARRMALKLGLEKQLQLLLSSDLDGMFSWEDKEHGDVVHNWRIRSKRATPTDALHKSEFSRVERSSTQQRTHLSSLQRDKQTEFVMKDRLEAGLVRWQLYAYQSFSKQTSAGLVPDSQDTMGPSEAIWDVFQALACDVKTLARRKGGKTSLAKERVQADALMLGNTPLERKFLGESRPHQHVYMAMMVEKLHTNMLFMAEQLQHATLASDVNSEPGKAEGSLNQTATFSLSSGTEMEHLVTPQIMLHDRMDTIQQELYRMKRKAQREMERISLQQQELQKQINTLEVWKAYSQQSRRSERVWILFVVISIAIGSVLMRSEDYPWYDLSISSL